MFFDATLAGANDNVRSGPRVIGYTNNAARRSCPTSLLRNVGSSYSEEPGVEIL